MTPPTSTPDLVPDLVIFDCDGVLVDTEQISNECMAEHFKQYGLIIDGAESRRRFQGGTLEQVAEEVARLTGKNYVPAMAVKLRTAVEARVSKDVKAIEGVVDLIRLLSDQQMPICVASSGSISKMHVTLGQVGLLDLLRDFLFSAQDAGRSKPHPDIFIRAARTMGFSCANSVIIEDSLTGVKAGVASGARVLGYTGDPFANADELSNAGAVVFNHMDEVPRLIGLQVRLAE